MYKIYTKKLDISRKDIHKILFIMRVTTFLLIVCIMQVSTASFAQNVTLSEKKANLKDVFKELRKQTTYDFICTDELFQQAKTVSIKVNATDLKVVLDQLFLDQPLTYTIEENTVVVKQKELTLLYKLKSAFNLDKIDVTGKVVDETGQAVAGATVSVIGIDNSTITDGMGNFILRQVQTNAVIVISFIGFDKREVSAKLDLVTVRLQKSSFKLDEVQIIAHSQMGSRIPPNC